MRGSGDPQLKAGGYGSYDGFAAAGSRRKRSASSLRSRRLRRRGDPHRLHIHELADSVDAQLPAEAGVFGSAEGDAGVGGDHGVDEDLAGVDAVDEAVHFGAVIGPDRGAEAEGDVVGGGDGGVDVRDAEE